MKKNKELWIKNVLDSKFSQNEFSVSNELLSKLHTIPNQTYNSDKIDLKILIYLAASIVIIIGFNLFTWLSQNTFSQGNYTVSSNYINYLIQY